MTKDEMKNRISMALKDSILQQGFEYICKENAELKSNNNIYCEGEGETLVVNVSFDKFTRINANHKMFYPRNEELEKENAELKEKYVKNICDCDICDTYCNSQLIKAKELLRKFLGAKSLEETFVAESETKKFLKEVS